MAAPGSIWIVLTADPRDWPVMAAFNFKPDCKKWLKEQDEAGELNLFDVYVLHTIDGAKAPNHAPDGLPNGQEFLDDR